MCECGGGGTFCKTDPVLVLQVCLGLGCGHLSPESPAAPTFLKSPLFQKQNQVSGSSCSVSTLWDGLIGQHKSLSICLAVPVLDTPASPTPRSQRVFRIPGGSACPSGHWQGTPSHGVLPVGVQYGGNTFVGWSWLPRQLSFRDQKSSEGLRLTQPGRVAAPPGGGNTFSAGPDAKPGLDFGCPGVHLSLISENLELICWVGDA